MIKPKKNLFLIAICCLGLCSFLAACARRQPVKIGFSGELTGSKAELGVNGRNGALLAVEDINAHGGVSHRKVELLIQNDFGSAAGALAADKALLESGVVAIVGHSTSAQSSDVFDWVNEQEIVMLSPTASTPSLSGQEDYFFRVCPINTLDGVALAQYAFTEAQAQRVVAVYDVENAAYTDTLWESFVNSFEAMGGKIGGTTSFSSSNLSADFAALVATLMDMKPDMIFILASSTDTALLAQWIRLVDSHIPLLGSHWAMTDKLLFNGGDAVEGMIFSNNYYAQLSSPALDSFKKRYESTYGFKPTFSSVYAYEAVRYLAKALEMTGGEPAGLREALPRVGNFEGLYESFEMDAYGEVQRPPSIVVVRNGQFISAGVDVQ